MSLFVFNEIYFYLEQKFSITLIPDQLMIRGGSAEPCGAGYLMSIGKLSSKENIAHSKVIFEKVCGDLKIPMDRLIIEFRDVKDYEVASNGTTIQNAEK